LAIAPPLLFREGVTKMIALFTIEVANEKILFYKTLTGIDTFFVIR
jgi:hypothetical protein